MVWLLYVLLAIALVFAGLYTLAFLEDTLRKQFGVSIPIVSDVWSAIRDIMDSIVSALQDTIRGLSMAFSAPFRALYRTLMTLGLPAAWANAIALVMLIVGFTAIAAVIFKIAR